MTIRRFISLVVALILIVGMFASPAESQPLSEAVLKLSFPYVVPPEGSLNAFVVKTLLDIGVQSRLLELAMGFYKWATGAYEPVLAESWGFVDDNSAYQIKLREDAHWSDGSPITAQDVVDTYTLAKIMDWPVFAYVSDVERVDDYTVRFNMDNPSTLVERLIMTTSPVDSATYGELAAEARAVIDSGATSDDEAWTAMRTKISDYHPEHALFSGPYMFELSDVGDAQMALHWQPNSIFSNTVKWGSVIIWAGEEDVVTPLVLSGDLYYSTNAYPAAVVEQFKAQGLTVIQGLLGFGSALYVQHDKAPLNILEVRKALAHAIDREEVAQAVVTAKAPKYLVGFPEHLYGPWLTDETIARLDPYEHDLSKADAYLQQAGYTLNAEGQWVDSEGKPFALEITVPAEFAGFTVAAENVRNQLNEFGLDITIRGVPNQQHIEEVQNSDFTGAFRLWGTGSVHPRQAYFIDLVRDNYVNPDLQAEGKVGLNFPMQGEFNGQPYDLMALYNQSAAGFELDAQRKTVGELAYLFNQMLPIIPIVEEIRANPINEDKVTGIPAPDDPIWQNTQTDNFFIWGVLNGTIGPKE